MAKHPPIPPIFEIQTDATATPVSPADLDAAVADLLLPPEEPAAPPTPEKSADTLSPPDASDLDSPGKPLDEVPR
jgi:hypothetical protein